ncbi:MAG: tetratricopeptide repeat protein [Candidatus Zixiibacteriota bacterium]|nr:MAG: tetratricopeptide repeat protein [candidate division Zixibacteria bacterium]
MRRPVRRQLLFIIALFVLAFGVRLAYLLQIQDSPMFDTLTMCAEYHDQWAQTILRGEDFSEGVFFRAPLYAYFLAFAYKTLGHGYLWSRLIQLFIGAVSCVLVYLLGKRVFNDRTGRIAGVVAALYGILIYFEGELLIPVLLVFLDLLLILALFWTSDKPSYGRWALCGGLLGLSAIARPNILLVGMAFIIWIVWRYRGNAGEISSKSLLYAGSFALGTVLIISPVTLRNYLKGHDLVLIASQGGMNFYIGNNPQSDGASAVLPGARSTWWGLYEDGKRFAEEETNRSLKPSQISRFWYAKAAKFLVKEPFHFLALMAKKFALFWNGNELSNNRDLYFFARSAPLLKLLVWRFVIYFPFGLIAPLALVGIILSHKNSKEALLLEIFLVVYMLSVVLFFVTARYRVPVIPVLILFSAYALDRFVYMIKRKKTSELVKYLLVFLVILIPVNLEIPGYSTANPGQAHYALGSVYSEKGDRVRAVEEFEKAIYYNPNLAEAYVNLGSIYGDQGRHELALEYYGKALEKGADSAFVHYNIGIEYQNQGLFDQAQEKYELSLSLRDNNPKVHYLLGEIYLKKGMVQEAKGQYEKTLRDDPLYALAFYRLGVILHRMGKRDEAIRNLEQFVRLWDGEPERIEKVVELLEEMKEKGGK